MNGIERFYHDAAYLAAVMVWLIEHKYDNEADAEVADLLSQKPFLLPIIFNVMKVWKP